MRSIYDGALEKAEKRLSELAETERLLEYPEHQADKKLYLALLDKYNRLKAIESAAEKLRAGLSETEKLRRAIADEANGEEREMLLEEARLTREETNRAGETLIGLVGGERAATDVICKIHMFDERASDVGAAFFGMLREFAKGKAKNAKISRFKDGKSAKDITFEIENATEAAELEALCGMHRATTKDGKTHFGFATAPKPQMAEPKDGEFRIETFRASGAGGQNVNKVETAIRAIHVPTGLATVCRDERSQAANRERAMRNLKAALRKMREKEARDAVEAELAAKLGARSGIAVDVEKGRLRDARLGRENGEIEFPPSPGELRKYLRCAITMKTPRRPD